MRVFIIGAFTFLLVIGFMGFLNFLNKPEDATITMTASLEDHYKTLDDLIKDSSLIVIGDVGNNAKVFEYEHANFTISPIKIDRVIMGPANYANATLNLLELNLTVVKRGNRYLLFLKPYEGPVSDDAYVVTGAYQGKFKIEGNRVDYVGNNFKGVDYFQSNLEKLSLDEVIREVEKRQGFTQ